MTTYYPLVPSYHQAPSFSPILDGNSYIITVIWNISSSRYFVQCVDESNNLIFFVPLVETKPNNPIRSLTYDELNSRVILTTINPMYYLPKSVINITVINTIPYSYSGAGMASVLNEHQMAYRLVNYPGPPTTLGAVDFLISLCKGYFNSTLVYRNKQFEVSP